MKKTIVGALLVASALLVGGALVATPAHAADNFVITDFDVEMELGRDDSGRSTLRTVETITADFQRRSENRGIERSFVKEYDGHSTSFELVTVTDEQGNALPHHWSGDTLRIGEEDAYVFGEKTYKITFTQRDVTRHYADTGKDEFYWDVIGTEWRVPIEQASVRLTLVPELEGAVETDLQCYQGSHQSEEACAVTETDGVYVVDVQDTGSRKGVTVALGFTPGTFTEYQPSLMERLLVIWGVVTVVTSIVAIGAIIWFSIRAHRWTYREAELGTIVPEYIPPKNTSVVASAAASPGVYATMPAQLTDLAVRHYIQILETREKSLFKAAEYDIKVIRDISDLLAEEREILSDMFGHTPKVGERLALKKLQNSTTSYKRFSDNDEKLKKLMRGQYGLKHVDEKKRGWFGKMAKISLVAAVLTLSPLLLVAGIVALVFSKTLWVLSDNGLSLRRYLKGLEMYMSVAEEDRLKMLQSPEGAEKVAIKDADDPAQLVKLYERVLPYAVLFGQEEEWSKRLGGYYERAGTSPDWYSGSTAFNAAAFSTMMTNFSTSPIIASAGSSSMGGSGGGGFSGGGGGGGGGGGW